MSDQLLELRAPARDARLGDIVSYQQHGFCEVAVRSNGPDALVLRTGDGRLVEVVPGEFVDIRRVAPEPEPIVPLAIQIAQRVVAELADPEPATVMETLDSSWIRYREEMGMPEFVPAPDTAYVLREIDRALACLAAVRQWVVAKEAGA